MDSHEGGQGQGPTEVGAVLNEGAEGGGGFGGRDITETDESNPLLNAGNETKEQREERVKKKLAAEQHELHIKLDVCQEEEIELANQYRTEANQRKERQAKQLQERGWKQPEQPQPAQLQPGAQNLNLTFNEIKNLVFIENSPIHKKALEEWERKEKLFSSRVERKATKVGNLKNEVYQLLGFFSVFQGVVFTAVSQANLLRCKNKWSPILLSVLASIVTIAAIAQKLYQISSFQQTIYSEEAAWKDVVHRGQELRREGPNFKFAKFAEDQKITAPKKDYFWLYSGRPPKFVGNRTTMTNRITLKNDLVDKEVRVKEGNAGVTRTLITLKPGQKYKMQNDPNATYREYIFITLPDEKPLKVVTSDDFAEFKEISIYVDNGVYDWVGTPRTAQAQDPSGGDTSTPTTPWWKSFSRKLGFKLQV